jgi:quercetin dioxygenase-like cupin family protein
VLLDGKFRIDLRSGSVMLERRGDYVMWGPGTDHSWEAVSDSTVLTVRWPSLA